MNDENKKALDDLRQELKDVRSGKYKYVREYGKLGGHEWLGPIIKVKLSQTEIYKKRLLSRLRSLLERF